MFYGYPPYSGIPQMMPSPSRTVSSPVRQVSVAYPEPAAAVVGEPVADVSLHSEGSSSIVSLDTSLNGSFVSAVPMNAYAVPFVPMVQVAYASPPAPAVPGLQTQIDDMIASAYNGSATEQRMSAVSRVLSSLVGEVTDTVAAIAATDNAGGENAEYHREAIMASVESILNLTTAEDEQVSDRATVPDYSDLEATLARIAAIQDSLGEAATTRTLPDGLGGLLEVLHRRLQEIRDAVNGTHNSSATGVVVGMIGDVLTGIEDVVASVDLSALADFHARAQALDDACGAFERQRDEEDWSYEMIEREKQLYTEVAELKAEAETYAEPFQAMLDAISAFAASAGTTTGDAPLSSLMEASQSVAQVVSAETAALEHRQNSEADTYARLVNTLNASKAMCLQRQAAHRAEAMDIVGQIAALTSRLQETQTKIAQAQEEEALHSVALEIVHSEHALNDDVFTERAAELQEQARDGRALQDVCAVVQQIAHDATRSVARLSDRAHHGLYAFLFETRCDQLALIAREYCKVSMSVCAAQARVQILGQKQESLQVKKQRCNLAQDIEGVEACNAEHADLQERIQAAAVDIEERRVMCNQLRQAHALLQGDIEATLAPHVDANARAVFDRLLGDWERSLAKLHAIEESQQEQIELDDVLDASFL